MNHQEQGVDLSKIYKKIFSKRILHRVYKERLGEPFIYNLFSLYYALFGDISKKIDYDLIIRQPYAFGLNKAFQEAKKFNINKISIIEFGVAAGAGLFNLSEIAGRLSQFYNIDFEITGFDTGEGMPKPVDYRDHPEKYRYGDYPPEKLNQNNLPLKTQLRIGPISETVPKFISELNIEDKIAFVSVDVDYYSSTLDCLQICDASSRHFLPSTVFYFDDVQDIDDNPFMGELLAIHEFNLKRLDKKISKMNLLKNQRIFRNAPWIDQMYFLHVLDSEYRSPSYWKDTKPSILTNPYL